MKRVFKFVNIICLLLLGLMALGAVSVPIVNDLTAKKIEKDLRAIPLPENTQLTDSISRAEKLVGNGNGMQYFGAILIQSQLSLEELDGYYSKYRENERECLVVRQRSPGLDFMDYYDMLRFSKYDGASENYYIVYSWGDGISPFDELDLRGH